MTNHIEMLNNGTKIWRDSYGRIHREDGPAIVYANGSECWFFKGRIHRDNGPAIILVDGTQEWYSNGRRHREDGPAVIHPDGREHWYKEGKLIQSSLPYPNFSV